eukprot:TRINITY_DN1085_c0_g1_i2.p1 TRINITY_DN1085_c0_g1~~TRINITY_DN1085_c0_g1_i2.p1  ORF type:complete len:592 (+),score=93.86 TRINITY_DN1085_c0_g1_i2:559-2334(+)
MFVLRKELQRFHGTGLPVTYDYLPYRFASKEDVDGQVEGGPLASSPSTVAPPAPNESVFQPVERPTTKLKARVVFLGELLGSKYHLSEPPLFPSTSRVRTYTWSEHTAEQFLSDVLEHLKRRQGTCYLGQIVLCKQSDGKYDLLDGLQRVLTILMTLAVLRDLRGADGEAGEGTETDVKWSVGSREEFFMRIQKSGGTKCLDYGDQQKYVRIVRMIYRHLEPLSTQQRSVFREYLIFNCEISLLKTKEAPGTDLFGSINGRGMGLSETEKLKLQYFNLSQNSVGSIEKLGLIYGNEAIDKYFNDMYYLLTKKGSVVSGQPNLLLYYSQFYDAFMTVISGNYCYNLGKSEAKPREEKMIIKINKLLQLIRRNSNSQWEILLIAVLISLKNEHALILEFLNKLERLFAFYLISNTSAQVIQDICNKLLESQVDLHRAPQFELTEDQKVNFFLLLNENSIYEKKVLSRYLLFRVNEAFVETLNTYPECIVDHLQPRNSTPFLYLNESLIDCIGNLTLVPTNLSCSMKTYSQKLTLLSSAQNCPLKINQMLVERYPVWDPFHCFKRKNELISILLKIWDLSTLLSEEWKQSLDMK